MQMADGDRDRVLPVHKISSKSKKLFVDGRTDGNLPPIVLGRLPKFGSRPEKQEISQQVLFHNFHFIVFRA